MRYTNICDLYIIFSILRTFFMFNTIHISFKARISVLSIKFFLLNYYGRIGIVIVGDTDTRYSGKFFLASPIRYKSIGTVSIADTCI